MSHEMTPLMAPGSAPPKKDEGEHRDAPEDAPPSLAAAPQFTVSSARWTALFHLVLLNAGQSTQAVVFSAVPAEAKSFFGLTTDQLDWLSSVYMFVFVAAVPLVTLLFFRFGQRNALRVASAFSLAGWVLRIVTAAKWQSYTGLFISQILFAVTNTFVFVAPPLLAGTWFGESERTVATAVGAISSNIGFAVGQMLPPFILRGSPRTAEEAWLLLLALEGLYLFVEMPLIMCFIARKPATPPNAAEESKDPQVVATFRQEQEELGDVLAEAADSMLASEAVMSSAHVDDVPLRSLHRVTGGEGQLPALEQLKRISATHAFLPILLAVATVNGSDLATTALLPQMLRTRGLDEEIAGTLGFIQALAGIVMVIPFSKWIDRRRMYHRPMLAILAVVAILYAVCSIAFIAHEEYFVSAFVLPFGALGVCQACMLPLAIEFAVEITFPYNTTFTTSGVLAAAWGYALVLMLVVPRFSGGAMTMHSSMAAFGVMAAMAGVSGAVIARCTPILHRFKYEYVRHFCSTRH